MIYRYFDFFAPSTPYSIHIYITSLTVNDYLKIVEKFKYFCRRDGVGWLVVFSTTDSGTATPKTIRTGKVGRPRKKVAGDKVDSHVHCLLVGGHQSAYSTAVAIKRSIDKSFGGRKCRVKSVGNGLHLYNAIDYCFRQGDIIRTGGDFSFKEHYAKCRECELFG